jgi:hypothetical protein
MQKTVLHSAYDLHISLERGGGAVVSLQNGLGSGQSFNEFYMQIGDGREEM